METITYNEALKLIDDFCIRSGVRHFCSTVCKGKCCTPRKEGECKLDKSYCNNICCVMFLCPDITRMWEKSRLKRHGGSETVPYYCGVQKVNKSFVQYVIAREYIYNTIRKRKYHPYSCEFFLANIEKDFENIKFDKNKLDIFTKEIAFTEAELRKLKIYNYCI